MLEPSFFPKALVFLEVASCGSFRAAGERLGLAPSTVSTHVRDLERALGARLLRRTTRRVEITREADAFIAAIERSAESWREGCALLMERHRRLQGTVRVTAPSYLAVHQLPAVIAYSRTAQPGIRIELLISDGLADLIDRQVDIAVRTGPIGDLGHEVSAYAVGRDQLIIVAAPQLAARWRDAPLDELARAPWCRHERYKRAPSQLHNDAGERYTLEADQVVATASSGDGMQALVEAGIGVGLMPRAQCAASLCSGRLERLLPEWRGRAFDVFVIADLERRRSARVDAVLTALRAHLPDQLQQTDGQHPVGKRRG